MRLKFKSKTKRDIFKRNDSILNQIRHLSVYVSHQNSSKNFDLPLAVFDSENIVSEDSNEHSDKEQVSLKDDSIKSQDLEKMYQNHETETFLMI